MKLAKALCLMVILCGFSMTQAFAANAGWPKSLTLGTASPGGVYLPYGQFLAKLWTEKIGIPVDALSTQGPVHNVKLIDLGAAQIGFTTMGIALQGWNGSGPWVEGKQYRNMRALFPMYDTPLQILVLKRSGITKLEQLNDQPMGVGPRAGTGGTYLPEIMKILGVSPQIKYGSISDLSTELLAGHYVASATMTGVPVPAFVEAESKEPLTFIRLMPEQIEMVQKAITELSASTIAANVYKSLGTDYQTAGVYNFAIGRADLPDDLVYQLLKVLFENQAALAKAVSAAVDTLPKNVSKDTFLPLHPGAIRYYRELGIKIPPKLIPSG